MPAARRTAGQPPSARRRAPPAPTAPATRSSRLARAVIDARDALLLVAGLAGIVYVTVTGHPDPALLALFAGMIGLPAVLRHDERS